MKNRIRLNTDNREIGIYIFKEECNEKIEFLIKEYKNIISIISNENRNDLKIIIYNIKNEISRLLGRDFHKNVLKNSKVWDQRIWSWKDSTVYSLNSKYVYKEWKESTNQNIEYLQKKYKILKLYLWETIPKTKIILWETKKNTRLFNENNDINTDKKIISLTIQKKVKWFDLSKMDKNKKENNSFLLSLEKEHKKYILLKYFLWNIIDRLWLDKNDMDLQLDLWKLSNTDSFEKNNLDKINAQLNSPNIMWDEKEERIYFIDFWFWKWDSKKEIIFNEMLKDSVLNDWKRILEIYWIN